MSADPLPIRPATRGEVRGRRPRPPEARPAAPLRIAAIGAFPFPLPQGSQVFARDHSLALVRAGARLTLFCYGRGIGDDPPGLRVVRIPRPLSPRRLASGPGAGKPLADLALAARLARSGRREGFDIALAHNAEAALAALAARPASGVPVVYVAHTLMGSELGRFAPRALRPLLDLAGGWLDRRIAAACDGVLALDAAAARSLGAHAGGPLALVPPGLEPGPAPSRARIAGACARRGLAPGGFVLYAGNLDPYQDLDRLAAAARRLPGVPFAVATHAPGRAPEGLRTLRLDDVEEGRDLCFGAAVCVLPRCAPGGFPIKLLNYMEASRPIVARAALAHGLVHDRSAWLVADDADDAALAAAIRALIDDPARARRLGAGARRALESRHAWPDAARRTLELASAVATAAG